jgi:GST-like protein
MSAHGLELHGAATGNSYRALIALLEAGLEVDIRKVDLDGGEHKQPAFLALNPDGKTPVLVRRDADGRIDFVLTQSNAIILWASDQVPGRLLPAIGESDRAVALERYFYFLTDVIQINFASFLMERASETAAAASLTRTYLNNISAAERFVAEGPFMAGERFSIADVAAWSIMKSMSRVVPWSELPNLTRWHAALASRPALQRAMAAFD